jgi:hypothetical protein
VTPSPSSDAVITCPDPSHPLACEGVCLDDASGAGEEARPPVVLADTQGLAVGSIADMAAVGTLAAVADPAPERASAGSGSSPDGNPQGNEGQAWCKPDGDTATPKPPPKTADEVSL